MPDNEIEVIEEETVGVEEQPTVFVINDDQNEYGETESENSPEKLNPLMYNMEVADSTLKCLKSLQHLAKRSSAKRQEYGKLCLLLFGPKYGDTEFMAALTDDMGFDSINEFLAFINIDGAEMKAGRPMTDKLLRQKMYNHWIKSSEISTDRRNARHMVKTKKLKIDIAIRDLDDENVPQYIVTSCIDVAPPIGMVG